MKPTKYSERLPNQLVLFVRTGPVNICEAYGYMTDNAPLVVFTRISDQYNAMHVETVLKVSLWTSYKGKSYFSWSSINTNHR
jgi:hypothetical protein